MKRAIVVNIKSVYGVEKIYPVCEHARIFASIAGTKTLTVETIDSVKGLGFEIIVEQAGLAQRIAS